MRGLAIVAAACLCPVLYGGTPLETWLHLGPVAIDVTKEFEHLQIYGLDRVGARLRPDQDASLQALAGQVPEEGQAANLLGGDAKWQLLRLRGPERLAMWSKTGIRPVLWADALQTSISGQAGPLKLTLHAIGGVRVFLNGGPVYQANWPGGRYDSLKTHTIDLKLEEGANSVTVVLFAIHLHVNTALYAETDLPVRAEVRWRSLEGQRKVVENDFRRLFVTPPMFRVAEGRVTAGIEGAPARFPIEFTFDNRRKVLRPGAPPIELAEASQLVRTRMTVKTAALLPAGSPIEGPEFTVEAFEPMPDVNPNWGYDQRRKHVLETAASSSSPARAALAAAALGLKISLAQIELALKHINSRLDTADFVFHDLIRLYYQFPGALEPPAAQAIADAAANFKYWMDEPGWSSMFMKSENHQMLFHSLQYMTGTLFPRAIFKELGAPGTVQALKGRILAKEWIDRRLRFGFDEWFSPGYLEKDVQSLLNIVDLPNDDTRLASDSRRLLDLLFTYLFTHEFNGYLASTAGRVYIRQVTMQQTQDTASLVWLLTGKGAARIDSGVVSLALSSWKPRREILDLAQGPGETSEIRSQQGGGAEGGANTITLRTPDHVLSTLSDYKKGERAAQTQVVQATLPGGVPVWINSAITTSEASRPGYWMGNWQLPRAFQVGELSIAVYRQSGQFAFSHCYFPSPWMDETVSARGWLAGRRGDGYVAVYSQSGTELVRTGLFRDFEIVSRRPDNIWLVQTGSRRQYPTLAEFTATLPQPVFNADGVKVGGVEAGWTGPLRVNGTVAETRGFPLIGNERVHGEYGTGRLFLKTKSGETLVLSND